LAPEAVLASDKHTAMFTRVTGEREGKTMDVVLAQVFKTGPDGRWTEYWALADVRRVWTASGPDDVRVRGAPSCNGSATTTRRTSVESTFSTRREPIMSLIDAVRPRSKSTPGSSHRIPVLAAARVGK
jgi:hypothetical protein